MNIKTIILLTLMTAATTIAATPQYDIIPLGKLTDNPNELTKVWSINDTGQIVGTSHTYDYRMGSPILYQPGNYNSAVDLTPDPTDQRALVTMNNNSGQVIGFEMLENSVNFIMFDETGHGNNMTIETNNEFRVMDSLSINDFGQVPGYSGGPALFNTTQPYNITRFNVPNGFISGNVHGVNNASQAVGYAYNEQYYEHAVLFEQDNVTDLGTLGGDNSTAFAINNSGQVVGMAEDEQGQPVATIFDTTGQGNNISLGLLESDSTMAMSINDNGQTIVWARERWGGGYWDYTVTDAYLYDGQKTIKLEDLIPEDSGWNIDVAWDINNLNQIIGWGDFNGEQRAFLMSPVPEPATLTILAIGTLLIRRRKQTC